MRNTSPSYLIVPLPCGCIADIYDVNAQEVDDIELFECPWCDTAIDRTEYGQWLRQDDSEIPMSRPPRMLFIFDGEVLEVRGHYSGTHMVSKPDSHGQPEPFYDEVSAAMVLRN